MVSVFSICLNFLHTRARFDRVVPGKEEKISTRSSGGRSSNDCGFCRPAEFASSYSSLLTFVLHRAVVASSSSIGLAAPWLSWQPFPASAFSLPTIRSSSSSSISRSESLLWSWWLGLCRLRHLRDCPTPQSLAHTAIRSHQRGNITSPQQLSRLQSSASVWITLICACLGVFSWRRDVLETSRPIREGKHFCRWFWCPS